MLITRGLTRLVILLCWLLAMSIVGFAIALVNNPYISFSFANWLLFVSSTLKSDFFYYHALPTVSILKLFFQTSELVVVSLTFSLFLSIWLNTLTIYRPTLQRKIYRFFAMTRVVPFIVLPLLFNQVLGNKIENVLTSLDSADGDFGSFSRLYVIISGQTDVPFHLLLNFLGFSITVSYFVMPSTFLMVSKVTQQVANYAYVKSLPANWSAWKIMRTMVLHRLIPVLLREIPPIMGTFILVVGTLEFLFDWRGIGGILFRLLQEPEKFGIEIGLVVFLLGTFLILIQAGFNMLRALYDYHGRKELVYEAD